VELLYVYSSYDAPDGVPVPASTGGRRQGTKTGDRRQETEVKGIRKKGRRER
jgi:hypothetical protein